MNINLQKISTDFKGDYCYTHARGAMMPDGFAIITTQPLRLTGCDVFYGMEMLTSNDYGKSWSPIHKSETIVRRELPGKLMQTFCDATPMYHKKSGKMLLVGHDAIYSNDNILEGPRPRHTLWSVYDNEKKDWRPFREIEMGDNDRFFSCGSGSGQYCELKNGDLLIPVYFMSYEESEDPWNNLYHVMIMRCSFDGDEIKLLEYGNDITVPIPRGLCEPSVICFKNRYFVALRNDKKGYVTSSNDGLYLEEPQVLVFDDGAESGNYCTQQHWLTLNDRLYMVYTRKAENNEHVFRHRAPLFIAEFDIERMCLVRSTEKIAVPERGARLGNLGCFNIAPDKAWVVASEWMQTNPPDPFDWTVCAKYGSDNSIFIAEVTP